jgi:putative membrane protein
MRCKFLAPVFALACVAPLVAFAASNPDASFYKSAAQSVIAEVQTGRLAQDKGSSQRVKDFGAMMVKDHSAAHDTLDALAKSKNIALPTDSSVGQMATKGMLAVLSGALFDQSYVKAQISAHRQTIALLKKEIDSGFDPDAQAFASATLPNVRSHLEAIKTLALELGILTE